MSAGKPILTRSLADKINDLLPQTQCRQCGFNGCRPYAEAIANQHANINCCPPGGQQGIHQLATLLQIPPVALDTNHGVEGPLKYAVIDEEHCIGCTLCIQACPVDAISGAAKFMHTVLNDWCTGCGLCVPPCPVDCIQMETSQPIRFWNRDDAQLARQHFEGKNLRLQEEKTALKNPDQSEVNPQLKALSGNISKMESDNLKHQRSALINQAITRARLRRTQGS